MQLKIVWGLSWGHVINFIFWRKEKKPLLLLVPVKPVQLSSKDRGVSELWESNIDFRVYLIRMTPSCLPALTWALVHHEAIDVVFTFVSAMSAFVRSGIKRKSSRRRIKIIFSFRFAWFINHACHSVILIFTWFALLGLSVFLLSFPPIAIGIIR